MPGRLPDDDVEALRLLGALAAALRTVSDFRVDLVPAVQPGAPFLRVAASCPTGLAEEIHCEQGAKAWWFSWSWGDRIGLATDIEGAAKAIRHVLVIRLESLVAPVRESPDG
jgi:hypothetical protein